MSRTLIPARATSPGRILQREPNARGWTQKDFAEIINRPPQAINEIIKGTKQITPETARELAAALGTSAEFWTNLEANYRLHLAKKKHKEEEIERRSRLYTLTPISELVKRGWIKSTVSGHQGVYLDNLEELAKNPEEEQANQLARSWLINKSELDYFVSKTKPRFSKQGIINFAQSQHRHPGIVLGRLQYDRLVPYQNLRKLLVKVKPFLCDWVDE